MPTSKPIERKPFCQLAMRTFDHAECVTDPYLEQATPTSNPIERDSSRQFAVRPFTCVPSVDRMPAVMHFPPGLHFPPCRTCVPWADRMPVVMHFPLCRTCVPWVDRMPVVTPRAETGASRGPFLDTGGHCNVLVSGQGDIDLECVRAETAVVPPPPTDVMGGVSAGHPGGFDPMQERFVLGHVIPTRCKISSYLDLVIPTRCVINSFSNLPV